MSKIPITTVSVFLGFGMSSGAEVFSSIVAFTAATAVASQGWLGDVIDYKNYITIFSGALITIGYSLATSSSGSATLMGHIIHGFGFGSIFCTIPAYLSEPGNSLGKSALGLFFNPALGAAAIQYFLQSYHDSIPPLAGREWHIGLVFIVALLLYVFVRTMRTKKLLDRSWLGGDSNTKQTLSSTEPVKSNDGHSKTLTSMILADGSHSYDYYSKPGQRLRPPPARTLDSPEWFQMRKNLLSRYIDVQPTAKCTPLVQKLQDHFWQGDKYMDPVVDLGRRTSMGKVRGILMRALANGIDAIPDAPQEILDLFEHLDRKPSWFSQDEYEWGRVLLVNTTFVGGFTALAMNFIITAQAASVANAVGSTGQYTNLKTVFRRHLETAHFFHRISLPGGSDRFSETFQEIVKVRFMHSQVRYQMKKRWGPDVFAVHGNPISNTDMALGITAFGVQKLISDSVFGRDFSTSDLDAATRSWGYIAYVFGVAEDLIPLTFKDGVEEFDYILSSHGTPSQWSPKVAESLFIAFDEAIKLVNNSLCQSLLRLTVVPLFHGLLYHFGGEHLGYRMLSVRYTNRIRMRFQAFLAAMVAKVIVSLWTITECRPGKVGRMYARAEQGDSVFLLRALEMIAQKVGLHVVTFETHDQSGPSDFGAMKV